MSLGDFAPTIRRRVVVTGIGLITPLGIGAKETWRALCCGQTATVPLGEAPFFLPTHIAENRQLSVQKKQERLEQLVNAMPCKVVAAVRSGDAQRYAPTARETRGFRFCTDAVEEALRDAGLLEEGINSDGTSLKLAQASKNPPSAQLRLKDPSRVGVYIGTGIPSLMDVTDVSIHLLQETQHVQYSRVHPWFVPKILGNMAAGTTAIKYGLKGPIGSSVAACATGAQCIGDAAACVRYGRSDVMVCGATEACITPVSIAGFSRMRALCHKYNDRPSMASRPFDKARGGFIMGEGAGILVIEEMHHALSRKAPRIYGEVRGFGLSCDAHDVAAPDPNGVGAQRCIEEALCDGDDVPRGIVGYVNAHATGTIGDEVELLAIERALLWGPDGSIAEVADHRVRQLAPSSSPLLVSSSKGALGHLLGAAGSVEAAIALLALYHQLAPPTANLTEPCWSREEQQEKGLHLVQCDEAAGVAAHGPSVSDHACIPLVNCQATISTSFGFGGVNTALLFARV